MTTIYGAFRTNSTMSNNQPTFGGVGTTFEINAYSSLTYNDGASTTVMAGDSITNEQPNDPTQTLAGNAIGWDYTIEVTDGTNTYQIGIIDYDINGDGDYDFPTAEQGYFLGFIGGIPPLNTTLTINGIVDNSVSIPISSFVPCFVSGTEIMTPMGPTIIENLKVGDSVLTANRGPQAIRWIGKRQITLGELTKNPKLRPVRIMASALGLGLPKRDLLISPQHRMLAQSKIAERMLGEAEVLVSAIKLTELSGIFVDQAVEGVEYFHLLFDQHEVIYAEGAPTESLFTGPEALKAISPEAREEILTIFPEVADLNYVPEPARFIPSGRLQKKLVARHLKNDRRILA
jgi:hypothetical protein